MLINKALPTSHVIHWTWSDDIKRESITEETNGKIEDLHYSENGHLDLANWILSQIKIGTNSSPYNLKKIL
jgi:hypothetical protein